MYEDKNHPRDDVILTDLKQETQLELSNLKLAQAHLLFMIGKQNIQDTKTN